jgi:hypothetical protein
MTTLAIGSTEEYPFPSTNHFAESFTVVGDKVFIPLNNTVEENSAGLYELDLTTTKTFTPVFLFDKGEVCFVAKRTAKYWVCNVTTTNQVLLYDHAFNSRRYVPIAGCPNDIVVDLADDNVIYVATNGDFTNKNGLVVRIHLDTGVSDVLLGQHPDAKNKTPLSSVSGINMVGDCLYVATLLTVVSLNVRADPYVCETLISQSTHLTAPQYDNISVNGNLLHCAIYDYDDRLAYFVFSTNAVAFVVYYTASCLGVIDNPQRGDKNRKMSKTKVHFVTYDCASKRHQYFRFDKVIPGFDKEVTQINRLDADQSHLMVNYKANRLVRVHTAHAGNKVVPY